MYLKDQDKIWIGKGETDVYMLPKMANRHGLIAGATGTGKTVTIKMLAESFSDMGVPVFLADIKGDVSGMCKPGVTEEHVEKRVKELGIQDFSYSGYPVRFFDVYGKSGIPIRTTISDMGPELLARILQLNDTQTGVLNLVFKVADDKKLLLIDTKDLRAMLQYAGDHRDELQTAYGNISTQSIGSIQRAMISLESSGGDVFFGEPELDIMDWMQTGADQKGYINLLNCVELAQSPMLYSTFLLWMLSDLYEQLPEAGDLPHPKMIFFFDEAHLLFNDAPKPLLQKVEQVARLIRSKGVGVYFITQSPADIPDGVLSQLGNKIQHALRAYTPKDKKGVKAAAESFRENPAFDSETVMGELETGEALISTLDEKGAPNMVERALILPPRSFLGVAEPELITKLTTSDPLYAKYGKAVDRESAFEDLQSQNEAKANEKQNLEAEKEEAAAKKEREAKEKAALKEAEKVAKAALKANKAKQDAINKVVGQTLSTVGKEVSRGILRGLFGNRKK